jgi:hypothetical protein
MKLERKPWKSPFDFYISFLYCKGVSFTCQSKTVRLFDQMKIAVIWRTFFRHQSDLLFPSINQVWKENLEWLLASLQPEQRDLVIEGDGRFDIPGHSAKYGSYTVMELKSNCEGIYLSLGSTQFLTHRPGYTI